MNEKNRNLALRVVSALVLFPAAVALTVIGGLPFALLAAGAALLAAYELIAMLAPRVGAAEALGVAIAGAIPIAAWQAYQSAGGGPVIFPAGTGIAIAFALILILSLNTFRDRPLEEAPRAISAVTLAWLYCGVLLATLVALRLRFGWQYVILAFIVTWGNDTAAYFAGRAFGRHPMYPRVSPKKTWEGYAGGVGGSVLFAFVGKLLLLPELTPVGCVVLGLGGALLGPAGDLAESLLKRAAGVKDSGNLIPGHGGLLDRIDALLFVAPWIYAFAAWLR
ncbi:MAG TPA: phosphatidate cytidylyltransferase [Anaeromyxobacteraceae bacterium]|jgi:phosphatidate cytidylyltransferase|nr:phosphatidate cytidylyltransferase [Anaeromyxobacteraceae bacterium]